MSTLTLRFGRALRQLRVAAGLSQDAFAERVGLDRTYVGRLERGRTGVTLAVLERIAAALAIQTSHLVAAAEEIDDSAAPEGAPRLPGGPRRKDRSAPTAAEARESRASRTAPS